MLNRTLKHKPADGSTHWSSYKLAAELGDVSVSTVQRLWRKHGVKPQQFDRHMVSNDPDFEAKAADVIGLYLNPPARAAVFCVDAKMGEDVSEQLARVAAAFKVIRTIRRKLLCPGCSHIVQLPMPGLPIERSIAHPSLLADIAVSKFADHQPLYCQSEIAARDGVTLDRASMGRWVARSLGSRQEVHIRRSRAYADSGYPETAGDDRRALQR